MSIYWLERGASRRGSGATHMMDREPSPVKPASQRLTEHRPSRKLRSALNNERDCFEFIARLVTTKHYGSMDPTRALVDMCHFGSEHMVLDVGCGVGATPCYLAKAVGCRVMGVDLLDSMVEQSRQRARAEGVEDRVEFQVADARNLPFGDNSFDAVILESLNVFFDHKVQAWRLCGHHWDNLAPAPLTQVSGLLSEGHSGSFAQLSAIDYHEQAGETSMLTPQGGRL